MLEYVCLSTHAFYTCIFYTCVSLTHFVSSRGKKLQVRSEKDKTTMKEETKRIQKEFKNQLGPHVDNPKQGCRKKNMEILLAGFSNN